MYCEYVRMIRTVVDCHRPPLRMNDHQHRSIPYPYGHVPNRPASVPKHSRFEQSRSLYLPIPSNPESAKGKMCAVLQKNVIIFYTAQYWQGAFAARPRCIP